jgi:site-specific DNA-methyltransferase (adenine-specific)
VKRTKITAYTPDPANPNRHTERGVAMLEDSIAKVGLGRSIVVDKNGIVLAGNSTQERAVDQGFEDAIEVETDGRQLVVVKRTDLDLMSDGDKARLLSYYDNRSAVVGVDFDPERVLADLNAGVDFGGLFSNGELDALLAGLREPDEDKGAQLDRADELRDKWRTARGQLWTVPSKTARGVHRLLCGDSTDAADVARVMAGERAALVVTDPPYGVEYADKNAFLNAIARGNRIQAEIAGDHGTKEVTQALWKAAFREMAAVMAPGAVVYCFMPQGGDQMMMMMMMMGAGIEPRHELIWVKNNHVLGRTDYAYKHEPILYAWKDGGHKFYGDFQTSVIECDKPQKSDLHPTMKPVELIARLVENSSQRSDVAYDPFAGSGTTMVACEQLGRLCRMIEIEPKYVAVILQRMADMGLAPTLEASW